MLYSYLSNQIGRFWTFISTLPSKIRLSNPDRQQELGEVVEVVNACVSAVWGIIGGIVLFRDFEFPIHYIWTAIGSTGLILLYLIYNTDRKKANTKFFKKWSQLPQAISNFGFFTAFLLSIGALIGTYIPQKQSFEETQAIIMAKVKNESTLVATSQEAEIRKFFVDDACIIVRPRMERRVLIRKSDKEEEKALDEYIEVRKTSLAISNSKKSFSKKKIFYRIDFNEEKHPGLEKIISDYYILAGGSTNKYDHRYVSVEKPDGNTVVAKSETWVSSLIVKQDGKKKSISWSPPLPNYSEVWKFRYSSEAGWQCVYFIGGIENGITGNANRGRKWKTINREVELLKQRKEGC